MPYTVHAVDITKNAQFEPAFLNISPNNKIPAIVDRESGLSLMESGAILIYLADKGGRFLPAHGEERWRTLEWLMWQMGGFGPMLGQAHHFLHFNPEASAYAAQRYGDEAARLYRVLEGRLSTHDYVAGPNYSIADMATWPWVARHQWQRISLENYPSVQRWYRKLAARPAVKQGYSVPTPAEIP